MQFAEKSHIASCLPLCWRSSPISPRLSRPLLVRSLAFLALIGMATGARSTPRQGGTVAERVFEKVSKSVVVVIVENQPGKPIVQGSGVVIGHSQVITNCHVASSGPRVLVRWGVKRLAASVQYADSDRDLCQLSVTNLDAPAVSLGTTKELRVGQDVYAVGAPEGLDLTLSEGIISALRPLGQSELIQTSAAISPGSSGGGLFDARGRLVGITSYQMVSGQNLNFALPADWIADLARRSRSERLAATHAFTGQFSGKVYNRTANISAEFKITVNQTDHALTGCMAVWRPLYGSGPLLGYAAGTRVAFVVTSEVGTITFEGLAENGEINGTYIVDKVDATREKGTFMLRKFSPKGLPTGFDLTDCPTDSDLDK